jgi:translation initiation factor IF-3
VTQGGHISTEPRINERIRVPEVRLVGPAGEQVGIVAINDALRLAQEADLDLVEVAPMARPPVAKLMDYGKFKYESALKARESRKNQAQTVIKEIKLRPKIDPHDYGTKKGHVERFLKAGDKVKVTIMFRGREQSRPELGFKLLQKLAADVEELGFVESTPKQDGRNMIMVIGPHKRKTEAMAAARADRASRGSRASANHEGSDEASADASADASASDQPQVTDEAQTSATRPADAPAAPPAAEPEAKPASPARAPARSSSEQAPAPSPTPRPSAPRPQPRPGGSTGSAAPKPTAPRTAPAPAGRPGANSGGSATPRPTAPRGAAAAARPAASTAGSAARPAASASSAAGSAARPVPSPRQVAADKAARQAAPQGPESSGSQT